MRHATKTRTSRSTFYNALHLTVLGHSFTVDYTLHFFLKGYHPVDVVAPRSVLPRSHPLRLRLVANLKIDNQRSHPSIYDLPGTVDGAE